MPRATVVAIPLRDEAKRIGGCLAAVSYTHLDVYKRQLLHAGSEFDARPFGLVAQQQLMGFRHGDA